jgi:biopolymer transport protein ExbB
MAVTGSGGFAVVAAGISEALIATAGGLLVGVLAIFAYNAFNVRINAVGAELRDLTDEIVQQIAESPAHEGSVPRVVQSR